MSLFYQLFIQFFYIGLFSFGGGYSTLPFLYDIAEKYGWYTTKQLTDMLALSSVTPGPVGVNVATFAGFSTAGILGAFIATCAVVLPSLIIVTIVSNVLDKFQTSRFVKICVKALKAVGCALLSSVGIKLLLTSNLHLMGSLIFLAFVLSSFIKKFDPLFYLGVSAIAGGVLGYFNLIGI